MKSIEIVTEIINKLKVKPELEYWKGNKINCLFHNEEGAGLLTCSLLQQIKKELEILEIIKRNTSISSVEGAINWYKGSQEISGTDFSEKIKDYNKLKQWLEENENENQ